MIDKAIFEGDLERGAKALYEEDVRRELMLQRKKRLSDEHLLSWQSAAAWDVGSRTHGGV